jgi:hypothetical protein
LQLREEAVTKEAPSPLLEKEEDSNVRALANVLADPSVFQKEDPQD